MRNLIPKIKSLRSQPPVAVRYQPDPIKVGDRFKWTERADRMVGYCGVPAGTEFVVLNVHSDLLEAEAPTYQIGGYPLRVQAYVGMGVFDVFGGSFDTFAGIVDWLMRPEDLPQPAQTIYGAATPADEEAAYKRKRDATLARMFS